jgi:hypothetical protein
MYTTSAEKKKHRKIVQLFGSKHCTKGLFPVNALHPYLLARVPDYIKTILTPVNQLPVTVVRIQNTIHYWRLCSYLDQSIVLKVSFRLLHYAHIYWGSWLYQKYMGLTPVNQSPVKAVRIQNTLFTTAKPAKRRHFGDLAKLSSLDRCPLYRGTGWQSQTPWGPSHIVHSRQVSFL